MTDGRIHRAGGAIRRLPVPPAGGGRPAIVFSFTITVGTIVASAVLADPEHLRLLDLAILGD